MPYNYELFSMDYDRLPEIEDDERCYRLHTGNAEDDVYAIVVPTDVDTEGKLRSALVRKYGARFHGWSLEGNYEDVTEVWFGGDAE